MGNNDLRYRGLLKDTVEKGRALKGVIGDEQRR